MKLANTTEHKHVEEQVRESERRYRLLAENVTDVIWTVNIACPTRLTYISPSVMHLLGYSVEEAMTKGMTEVFTPVSFDTAIRVLKEELAHEQEKLASQSRSRTIELELIHKNGSIVDVEVNYSFIRGVDGQPVEVLITARDITVRKKVEKLLRHSEKKYSTLVEKGNDAIVIIQDGLLVFVNFWLTNITGFLQKELIGRSFTDFVAPTYKTLVAGIYEKRIAGEEALDRYEIEILSKDGRNIPVEISASVIEYEDKPADMAIIRDITERRKVIEELRESENKLRLISENARDVICLHDSAHRYVYISHACKQILGYDPQELIGTNPWDLVHPQDLEGLNKMAQEKALKGEPVLLSYRIRKKSGEYIWFESTNQLLTDDEGNITGFVTSSRDVSERKKIEEEARNSEHKLLQAMENTIQAMAMIVEMRDPYTAGHQRRVTDLACAIAREMGISDDKITGIRMAGLIHDIGKIRVPTEILTHPDGLSEAEFNMIKVHPQVGHEILKTIESPWPIADIVYQHHERINGSGYPSGLKGDEIIQEARILAVADVVEAMASHRPYRPARGLDMALDEISKNKGLLYDSQAVDACLKLFREKRFEFK